MYLCKNYGLVSFDKFVPGVYTSRDSTGHTREQIYANQRPGRGPPIQSRWTSISYNSVGRTIQRQYGPGIKKPCALAGLSTTGGLSLSD